MSKIQTSKEHIEAIEEMTLSPFAVKSKDSKGRQFPVTPCSIRTDFMRDRDRVIHCKSFRRLKHKTQVFLAPAGDHYRTRLTHTLEVSQIARTIARGLRLNEDLTEAIALAHDLGHTPFGHVGESVLDRLTEGGFRHNEQSLRVVEKLENGVGLNLTFEVRDGILNHRKSTVPSTLEGEIVRLADRIAYINHDIDDAVRAGVLRNEELPKRSIEAFGNTHGERINSLILDVYKTSFNQPHVALSCEMNVEFDYLRDFMFEHVYYNPSAKREDKKGEHVIELLFDHYMHNPTEMGIEFTKNINADGIQRVVADYIACMTDRYAIADYKRLFVPSEW